MYKYIYIYFKLKYLNIIFLNFIEPIKQVIGTTHKRQVLQVQFKFKTIYNLNF